MKSCINPTEKPVFARGLCGTCYYQVRKAEDPELLVKMAERSRSFYAANPGSRTKGYVKTTPKKYKPKDPLARKKRKYGITTEQLNKLFADARGCCGVCNKFVDILCVDHCHSTKIVRGLLCHACNKAIGLFEDNEEVLLRAAAYLKQSRS